MMIDQDLEASVIGGLLLGGLTPTAIDVLATLPAEAFGTRFYRETYLTIQKQARSRNLIDALMVAEAMGENHFADVMETARKCPSAANLKGYAGYVAKGYADRLLVALMDEYRPRLLSGSAELREAARVEFIAKASNACQPASSIKPIKLVDLLTPYTEQLEVRVTNGEKSDNLKTGITDLDEVLGGINPVDLVIVAARPGMGKTEFALTVAQSVAEQPLVNQEQKRGVLIFSMEMDGQQIAERKLASAANLPVTLLRNPYQLNDEGWARVSTGIQQLVWLDVWIVDASKLTVEQIRAISERHKQEHPALSLIMVDYLGLIDKPKAERNDLAIGHISGELKRMAKELRTPVMSLSQLSRSLEQRTNKRPTNGDLRDSGSIEQDADSIIMLYRDAVYNGNSPAAPYAEIIVTKNRHGKQGTVYQEFKHGHFVPTNQVQAASLCQAKTNVAPIKRYAGGALV